MIEWLYEKQKKENVLVEYKMLKPSQSVELHLFLHDMSVIITIAFFNVVVIIINNSSIFYPVYFAFFVMHCYILYYYNHNYHYY